MTLRHRRMSLADLETVLDWAADEGWNPGLDDAAAFLAADPDGFFVAETLDEARPVAAISVVNHSDTFAFLGLYLCRPEWRGQGVGYALWQHALGHAGARCVGLDGVPDQQANYQRAGFARAGETTRYQGRPPAEAATPRLRQATQDDLPAMIALEEGASGWAKPAYLGAWLGGSATRRSFVLEEAGQILGMATLRDCRTGAKIGPLVAPDADAARALLSRCAAEVAGPLFIDVPSTSAPLDDLCRALGMEAVFNTARMYHGAPRQPGSDLYAVSTLELG